MEGQPTAAEPKHLYQSHQWPGVSSNTTTPRANTAASPDSPQTFFPKFELYPVLLAQQDYKDKLLNYNKLVSGGRGGGGGLQTPPLPPVISSSSTKATTRPRSSSKVSNKDNITHSKAGAQNGHGNRATKTDTAVERAIASSGKDLPSKMTSKKFSEQSPANPGAPPRPLQASAQNTVPAHAQPTHSSSVPSTPHQHARKFSFESRDPSPGATQNHSPRSAYSEANGNVPSLRPLPQRHGGCRFETAIPFSRRRMPYSDEKLPKIDLDKIKSGLSEVEEKTLNAEMDDLYGRLLPKTDDEINRKKLVHKLEKLFNDRWPNANIQVRLFGSSGNLLCTEDSDGELFGRFSQPG